MSIEYEHVKTFLQGEIKRKSVNWAWYRKVVQDKRLVTKLNNELREEIK
jgi:hypothetical protein